MPRRLRSRPLAVGVATGVLAAGVAGVILLRIASANADDVRLTADPGGTDGLHVAGSARASAQVISLDGGAVAVTSVPGGGNALRFGQGPGVAVVSVRAQRPGDVLSPGLRAFSFGVDVATDAGGDTDDNVVQRGLSDDLGQYKIELDRGLFTCTVKGADGRVTARLSEPRPEAGVWYRIHCRREGGTVDLKVTRLDTGEVATTTSTGSIGEVRTADPTAPLSIGGKLTQVGAIAAWAPDQFDGALDNVWLRID